MDCKKRFANEIRADCILKKSRCNGKKRKNKIIDLREDQNIDLHL